MFVAVDEECIQTNTLVKFLYSSVYVMAMAVTEKYICALNSAPYPNGSLDCPPFPQLGLIGPFWSKKKEREWNREEKKESCEKGRQEREDRKYW